MKHRRRRSGRRHAVGVGLASVLLLAGCQPSPPLQHSEQLRQENAEYARLCAIHDLHDVRDETALRQLEVLVRDESRSVRNVAALALGGQHEHQARAGAALLRAYGDDRDDEVVLSSALDALAELRFRGCWPAVKPTLRDGRLNIVVRTLRLLAAAGVEEAVPELEALHSELLRPGPTLHERVRARMLRREVAQCLRSLRAPDE